MQANCRAKVSKGQYEVLNPSYSEKKLARMKPQNRFNASAPGQPVRTIAFENFLVFNNEAEFGMILNKHLKGNGF